MSLRRVRLALGANRASVARLASIAIVLAGFAGSVLPALRAAKVDPVVALRAD